MNVSGQMIRVVVAKPGLDGHDRGAKIVARALRDAGMEVIYTGLHQTPEQIVPLFSRTLELLKAEGAKDVLLFGGGIIPDADIATLKGMGVSEIFTPGTPSEKIVEWVRANVKGRN
jgi:methylmalonyl-CoA mutase C-terminal domain/subunit